MHRFPSLLRFGMAVCVAYVACTTEQSPEGVSPQADAETDIDADVHSGGAGGMDGASTETGGTTARLDAGVGDSAINVVVGTHSSPFAGACTDDSDCVAGLVCATAEANWGDRGAPQGGYCTIPCLVDSPCTAIDGDARCLWGGFCARPCSVGVPDADKCGGRIEGIGCATILFGPEDRSDLCVPRCQNNAACGVNRFCNLSDGTCMNSPRVGDPIGTACTLEEQPTSCAYYCQGTGGDTAACTARCTVGAAAGCGVESYVAGGPICVAAFSFAPGDASYCGRACNCDDDCLNGDICEAIDFAESGVVTDALGRCFPDFTPTDPSDGIACDDAISDGG
jgi:hypothetical protein